MPASLFDFSVIRPSEERSQKEILEWLARAHANAEGLDRKSSFYDEIKKRLFALGTGEKKIETRAAQILKYLSEEGAWTRKEGVDLKTRSDWFEIEADEAFARFYGSGVSLPDHLIHVSCTGYLHPGPAQKSVSRRKGTSSTTVTNAYHMGCYGSMPAIRIGTGFLRSGKTSVDIVHTELCSLHMNPSLHDTEQLVIQTLFGDGFIKYSLLSSEGSPQSGGDKRPAFHILALHEEIVPDSPGLMSWRLEDWGMKMTVSKEVPSTLRRHLPVFLDTLWKKSGLDCALNRSRAFYAVHPGGPKIIRQIATLLGLGDERIFHSEKVLRSFGNMSSATLPHIWNEMLEDGSLPDEAVVVSLAFGPGLTLSGAVYRKGFV